MSDDITPDAPQDATDDVTPETTPAEKPEDKHSFKHEFRDAVGKVVGIAVETGSMLSGNAGDLVSAEGAVAEADTEKLLDRIDGEG
jgi:hypothetical protein